MRYTSLKTARLVLIGCLACPAILIGQSLPIPIPSPVGGPGLPPPLAPPENEPQSTDPSGVQEPATTASQTHSDLPSSTTADLKRDPFWPVGYTPKPIVTAATTNTGSVKTAVSEEKPVPINWEAARKNLDIRGISLIGRDKQTNTANYLAVIGGKVVEVGDSVSATYMSRVYRWRVTSIGPEGISLSKLEVRPE